MGTFSDVAFAIKKDSYEALSADAKNFLKEYADDTFTHEGDKLFIFNEIKWYPDDNGPIKDLIEELENFDSFTYKLIEACFDYPNSDNQIGCWEDPWGISLNIKVSLSYEDLGDLEQNSEVPGK
jgi:hypothetical protein